MNPKSLPIEKIEFYIQLETFVVFISFLLLGWIFYKVFLKKITEKRHFNLKYRFKKTINYLLFSMTLAFIHWSTVESSWADYYVLKIANYLGLLSFIAMIIVLIRSAQVYVYLYLFWANMSQGVPRLLANLFTLLFSTFIISWVAADVFGFNIATVLATSAIFTIVLGLALQDTLGNLFSGVALQIERPFQIEDWVEIHHGSEKWIGQIQEITWRATSLIGHGDELIVIPNKTIAQSQLIIFSEKNKPARFNHVFRFPFDVDILKAKAAILEGVKTVQEVLLEPAPRVLIMEVTESWVSMKIFYSLKDYGRRYQAGDLILINILESLKRKKLPMATTLLGLTKDDED